LLLNYYYNFPWILWRKDTFHLPQFLVVEKLSRTLLLLSDAIIHIVSSLKHVVAKSNFLVILSEVATILRVISILSESIFNQRKSNTRHLHKRSYSLQFLDCIVLMTTSFVLLKTRKSWISILLWSTPSIQLSISMA
jgi:hypothetical protein